MIDQDDILEDEEEEKDSTSGGTSRTKKKKKGSSFMPMSKTSISKMGHAELNKKLTEIAKEIKVFKAQNRYLTKRCLHLSSVMKSLQENNQLIPKVLCKKEEIKPGTGGAVNPDIESEEQR